MDSRQSYPPSAIANGAGGNSLTDAAAEQRHDDAAAADLAVDAELARLRHENARLRGAVGRAGFAVMQTSGEWSIFAVGERAAEEDAKSLDVATKNAELEAALATLRRAWDGCRKSLKLSAVTGPMDEAFATAARLAEDDEPAADAVGGWVPVARALPGADRLAVVWREDAYGGQWETGYWTGREWRAGYTERVLSGVTHWQAVNRPSGHVEGPDILDDHRMAAWDEANACERHEGD